ncbi:hypothetical protein LPJ61_003048 [Coemansia biformis]|uniref:Cyclin N-terminal domain-containing protein n=1 Tax=Coemansia biformis TaxID=1286918 RepID=A0A9W8CVW6_9FUNG|nr:hypothetical protein LPJ61_003048 [Coemansia biformis]
MISSSAVPAPAERRARSMLSMRLGWPRKDAAAAVGAEPLSPVTAKIKELTASGHAKSKTLSRTRVRELLTLAVIRLMERMIAELFPCAGDGDPDGAFRGGVGSGSAAAGPLPSFEDFLKHICRRTRTPLTCMCLALLYLTRLRANHPRSRGSPGSAYRLALSSLCVATKYLYDDAYHTCSWVQVSMGLFSQREVNQMEMEFMYFLHYQLGVTPTEWNQWIATLEAKLVSRWQENGKADVIYSFGLFLSSECCEPSAQEAVRDIAWGEGGRSLLALLNNAIHLSGCVDPAKCSPSADSAVSDTTCLPTPDPNTWFNMRSPLTAPGPSAAAATASATPLSVRYATVPALGDDAGAAAATAAQKQRELCTRHSYVEYRGPAVFPVRPSSVCSVPAAPLAAGLAGSSAPGSGAGVYAGPYAPAHLPHRHVSESRSYDWSQQSARSASSQHMGSGTTIAGYAHNSMHYKGAASPFDAASRGTTNISLSYSSDSRDSATATAPADTAAQVPSARGPLGHPAGGMHFGTVPRTAASARSAIGSGYAGVPLDKRNDPAAPSRISSMGGRAAGPIPIPGPRPSAAAATASCRGFRSSAYSTIDVGTAGGFGPASTQRYLPGGDAGVPSASASRTASPSIGQQNGSFQRSGSGAGAGQTMGIHTRSTPSKSPSPSLKGGSRRYSWRYSGRHSASNIAQKLRSLAAFGRSSGSSGSGSATGGRGGVAKASGSYDDIGGRSADDSRPLGEASVVGEASQRRASGFPLQTITNPNSHQHRYSHGPGSGSGHGCHSMLADPAGRRAEIPGRRPPLGGAHRFSDGIPSYDLELDMGKYVSMRT